MNATQIMVSQAGMSLAGLLWGVLATALGFEWALLFASTLGIASALAARRLSIDFSAEIDQEPHPHWGIGHSITLLIVGGAIILFGVVIPERLGMSLEFCVALMLILLGLLNLGSFRRSLNEVQLSEHSHPHGFYLRLRPVFVGVVHGLAGSAAVALLVLPLIREPGWATFYLLIFGAGTIAGMMLITVIVAVPITYSANRSSLLTAISAPRPARSV